MYNSRVRTAHELYHLIMFTVIMARSRHSAFGQGTWNICSPTTILTLDTTVYIVSPGYPNRMDITNRECSCIILPLTTNNAPLHVTARYVDWNVDSWTVSKWSTLTFVTDDSGNSYEIDLSADISGSLIDTHVTGLVVNLWRMSSVFGRSGYFKLEINSTVNKGLSQELLFFNVTCTYGYQTLPILSTRSTLPTLPTQHTEASTTDLLARNSETTNDSPFNKYNSTEESESELPLCTMSCSNSGAIVGIVIGSIGVVMILTSSVFWIIYCRNKRSEMKSSDEYTGQGIQTFPASTNYNNDPEVLPTYENNIDKYPARTNTAVSVDPTYESTAGSIPVDNQYEPLRVHPIPDYEPIGVNPTPEALQYITVVSE